MRKTLMIETCLKRRYPPSRNHGVLTKQQALIRLTNRQLTPQVKIHRFKKHYRAGVLNYSLFFSSTTTHWNTTARRYSKKWLFTPKLDWMRIVCCTIRTHPTFSVNFLKNCCRKIPLIISNRNEAQFYISLIPGITFSITHYSIPIDGETIRIFLYFRRSN